MKNAIIKNTIRAQANLIVDAEQKLFEAQTSFKSIRETVIGRALNSSDAGKKLATLKKHHQFNLDRAGKIYTLALQAQCARDGITTVYNRETTAAQKYNGEIYSIQGDMLPIYFKVSNTKTKGLMVQVRDTAFPVATRKRKAKVTPEQKTAIKSTADDSSPSTAKSTAAPAAVKVTSGMLRASLKGMSTVEKQELLTIAFDSLPANNRTSIIKGWAAKLHFNLRSMTAGQIKKLG